MLVLVQQLALELKQQHLGPQSRHPVELERRLQRELELGLEQRQLAQVSMEQRMDLKGEQLHSKLMALGLQQGLQLERLLEQQLAQGQQLGRQLGLKLELGWQ